MKKLLTICVFVCTYSLSFAQDDAKIDSLIKLGIQLHDIGEYEAAIEKYDEALKIDKNNITALGEKALSYSAMHDYNATIKICKKAIKIDSGSKDLAFVYTSYANALDKLKKPQEALKIYDEGLKTFPDFYQLHFNKGITLSGLNEIDKALLCFHKSVTLNPNHPGSHNAIARLLGVKKNNIPSLLAFCRFLVLEPQGRRAEKNLPFVRKIMKANVEKKDDKNITINIDPSMFETTKKKRRKKKKPENNFSQTDLILSMSAALDYDDKNKDKTEVELFQRKFKTICSSLKETKKDNTGFYWEHYAPYFIEMYEKDLIEAFSYIVYACSEIETVPKWLDANKEKLEAFFKWSMEYKWE